MADTQQWNYLECWTQAAVSLFAQALAGEPVLSESLPKPMPPNAFGFAATIEGDEAGRFAVVVDGGVLDAALLGEGGDAKAGWSELLKEVADSAAGDLLARTGRSCRVTEFQQIGSESKLTRAFQLKSGDRSWAIQVHSEVRAARASQANSAKGVASSPSSTNAASSAKDGKAGAGAAGLPPGGVPGGSASPGQSPSLSPGFELLLDVELEASLRFGAREMPLGEILDLGPGDVVQLDRHIADPVDLIVGDKIVARGEVVLVNGNFGLRVTEVAEPQKRLESIRCLF